jgi:hypothetical protein
VSDCASEDVLVSDVLVSDRVCGLLLVGDCASE